MTISAVTVAGIYAYRRLTEGSSSPATVSKLIGTEKPPPPLGAWATAWGLTFLVVSMMAEASPGLGGGFAILIMTADILTNSASLFGDVGKAEKGATTTPAATSQNIPAAVKPLPTPAPTAP